MMTRKQFLQGLAAGAAAAPLTAQTRKRNLVFIFCDDHRADAMGCMGHPWLKTPNLDRLAAGGALFRNAFVTTSLCSPSRASVLTGLYAHAHGVMDNFTGLAPNQMTFPKRLKEAGYTTAFIGKWHMGDSNLANQPAGKDEADMPQPGFDHWISFKGQGAYRDPVFNINGERRKVQGYTTDLLTDESVQFLNRGHKKPFMLFLSHKAAHAGFEPAERHAKLYSTDPVPVPPTAPATAENVKGKPEWLLRKRRHSRHGLDALYAGNYTLETLYRDYCRTLQAVDDSVGRVYETLQKRGLLQDTLIIYMGDNGFLMGEQGLVDKRVMYEASIRVPLIAHCPSMIRARQKFDQLALNIDICPTFLEAAGAGVPEDIHGKSLLPVLRGEAAAWRKDFLYEYFWDWEALHTPTVLGLRSERYSYMEYQGIWDINELYDIQSDPHQAKNIIGDAAVSTEAGGLIRRIADPEVRERVMGMRQRMAEILNETNGRLYPTWRLRSEAR